MRSFIIDTHTHLDNECYLDDLDSVIKNAVDNGVKYFIIPGTDDLLLDRAYKISQENEHVYFAVGVHPCNAHQYDRDFLLKYIEDDKCVAVGECGLDYFRLDEDKKDEQIELQKEVFVKQIELALEFNKPIIVHIRDAKNSNYASIDSKNILVNNSSKKVGGVLHCYNADEALLSLIDHNFYFGIGGVVTFKNAKALTNAIKDIPLNRILLETDSPYLTPHPHRGKRNEPHYTTLVAKKLSELLCLSYVQICDTTTSNAKTIFKLN